MATAKVRVLVTLNGVGVWQVVAEINPKYVRRLSEDELESFAREFPRAIEAFLSKSPKAQPESTPKKKKR